MHFNKWINENTFQDLYVSTVQAFPRTTKRQHAIDPINIVELNWTPFLGMNTLFVKGLAYSGESGKEYGPIILFKGISYHPSKDNANWVEIITNGHNYVFEKIKNNNEVLVRCNCQDFKWRWTHTDYLDHSLYGRNRKKYEALLNPGSSNPLEMPGMCKHIIKLFKTLNQSGIFV